METCTQLITKLFPAMLQAIQMRSVFKHTHLPTCYPLQRRPFTQSREVCSFFVQVLFRIHYLLRLSLLKKTHLSPLFLLYGRHSKARKITDSVYIILLAPAANTHNGMPMIFPELCNAEMVIYCCQASTLRNCLVIIFFSQYEAFQSDYLHHSLIEESHLKLPIIQNDSKFTQIDFLLETNIDNIIHRVDQTIVA
jgi:hypothetical protein